MVDANSLIDPLRKVFAEARDNRSDGERCMGGGFGPDPRKTSSSRRAGRFSAHANGRVIRPGQAGGR